MYFAQKGMKCIVWHQSLIKNLLHSIGGNHPQRILKLKIIELAVRGLVVRVRASFGGLAAPKYLLGLYSLDFILVFLLL